MRKTAIKSELNDKAMLTCDEVAEFLRVHVISVRRWSRSGKLKAFKVGGRGDWRYRHQDVLAFLYDTNTNRKKPDGGDEDDQSLTRVF